MQFTPAMAWWQNYARRMALFFLAMWATLQWFRVVSR